MARILASCLLVATFALAASEQLGRGAAGSEYGRSLLQTYDKALSGTGAGDTPVTRVVKLLEEMGKTLSKEMEEDEALYKELKCWCSKGDWEKSNAIEASQAKIGQLEASIGSLTAKSSELTTTIAELEADVAANKQALAEATAIRQKQLSEFHGSELDSIQAIENLKAAIGVLSKHHMGAGGTAPTALHSTVAGGPVFKSESDSWSFLSLGSKKWEPRSQRSLDDFMRQNNFDDSVSETSKKIVAPHKFLQEKAGAETKEWSTEDDALVKRALQSASAFVQARHGEGYFPAYAARSGEIMGILKQLKEEMEGDLSESQKLESERAATFADLRAAKTLQIENGEKMAERKEDELADTNNLLAEAKEDLEQEKKVLAADQEFLANLKATCAEADKNFETRKASRLEEIKAVGETIEILTADEARDAMTGTFSFVQVSASRESSRRKEAAATLRRAARKMHSPQLSMLATAVELNAFTKVKKAIDDMIAVLKLQQEDEVKKNDWCKGELHENEMATAKMNDLKADQEAKIAELASNIKALEEGIVDAKAQIAQLQLDLQSASENRRSENLDYQKNVADQAVTIEVLKVALDRLAKYYDFMQTNAKGHAKRQTPPVPQMEYTKNQGASGVMEMIEKLVYDAKELMANSKKSESDAQAAYEQNVADTNASVHALGKEIVTKAAAKVQAEKDKLSTESDLGDTMKELEGLDKYNAILHQDCDYILKNFSSRQEKRAEEIEALQQAKQILSGASLSS